MSNFPTLKIGDRVLCKELPDFFKTTGGIIQSIKPNETRIGRFNLPIGTEIIVLTDCGESIRYYPSEISLDLQLRITE